MARSKSIKKWPTTEQETVIQIDRETGKANIYTTDSRYVTKLDKIYERAKEHLMDDRLVAVEYCVPERRISFLSREKKRTLTSAQKKAASERMKKLNEVRH